MFPLKITTIQKEKGLLRLLLDFMGEQEQYYPNYGEWLNGKCKNRLESGEYRSIVAVSGGLVVGDAVYRYIDKNNVEIKNFRIDPDYQDRAMGQFLLRQVGVETSGAVKCLDVSVDNFQGVEFFIHNGFKITSKECLYSPKYADYLMRRVS